MSRHLRYRNEDHSYEFDGKPVLSVTRVLVDSGLASMEWVKEWNLERGRAVHDACWYLDQGDLDESSVDPAIKGFVDAYKGFRKSLQPEVLHAEKVVHSKLYGYCGRLDRVVRIKGVTAILELKTNSMPKHVNLQTAAYWQAAYEGGIHVGERLALLLLPNGQFKLRPHLDKNDLPKFLEALKKVKESHEDAKRISG